MSQAPVFDQKERGDRTKPLLQAGPRALSQHLSAGPKALEGADRARVGGQGDTTLSQLGSSPVPQVATLASVFGDLVSKLGTRQEEAEGPAKERL